LLKLQPRWVIVEYPRSVKPAVYELLNQMGFAQVKTFRGWADWTNGDILLYQAASR
jgi:hypothetical protein